MSPRSIDVAIGFILGFNPHRIRHRDKMIPLNIHLSLARLPPATPAPAPSSSGFALGGGGVHVY